MIALSIHSLISVILSISLLEYVLASSRPPIRAQCVFPPEEIEMHKYSAVLAVTEPFRERCKQQLQSATNPFAKLSIWIRGKSIVRELEPARGKNAIVNAALCDYERRVETALKSYGMTVETFNSISMDAVKKPSLKRRIKLQAAYYKIAADLETNLRPELPLFPSGATVSDSRSNLHPLQDSTPATAAVERAVGVKQQQQQQESQDDSRIRISLLRRFTDKARSRSKSSTRNSNIINTQKDVPASQLQRFSRSLRAIEDIRLRYRSDIQLKEFGGEQLPPQLTDSQVQQKLSPAARRLCSNFPREAQSLLTENGIKPDEFDSLMKKVKSDVFFRWGVNRELQRLAKSSAAAAVTAV